MGAVTSALSQRPRTAKSIYRASKHDVSAVKETIKKETIKREITLDDKESKKKTFAVTVRSM